MIREQKRDASPKEFSARTGRDSGLGPRASGGVRRAVIS
jgi:hypothetical protein